MGDSKHGQDEAGTLSSDDPRGHAPASIDPGPQHDLVLGPVTSRRELLKAAGLTAGAGGLGLGLAACGSSSTATASTTTSAAGTGASFAKPRFLVYAATALYGQPALLGIPVGMADFTQMAGWKFKFTAPQEAGNVQQIIQAMQQALALKPDVIVTVMADPTSYNVPLKAIYNSGIYLSLCNAQPQNGNPFGASYVGQIFVESGVSAVQPVLDANVAKGRKSGQIIVGFCCGGAGPVAERAIGNRMGIDAYNKAHGTSFQAAQLLDTSETDPTQALSTWTAKFRGLGKSLAGVVVSQVGNPPVDAAKALGYKPGEVPIITFDSTPARLDLLDQGWFLGIVDQQPYVQGFISAAHAFMHFLGSTPIPLYNCGTAIITKSTTAAVRAREAYLQKRASDLGYKV